MSTSRLLSFIFNHKVDGKLIRNLASTIDNSSSSTNPAVTLTYATNLTIPVSSSSRVFRLTLTGNCNLDIGDGAFDGQTLRLSLSQDSVGSRLVTLSNKFRFSASAPLTVFVLSTAANSKDVLTMEWDNQASKWDMLAFMKGF
jgi:hypothetical protein